MPGDAPDGNAIQIMNAILAERREPAYTLEDLLEAKTVKLLGTLARLFRLSGYRKMRKAEIISILLDRMSDLDNLKKFLMYLSKPEWEFFKKAVKVDHLIDEKVRIDEYLTMYHMGIIGVYNYYSHVYFIVPREIRHMYEELEKDGFPERKERCDLLNDFACAAINLYGVISQDDFVEIFNGYNDQNTDVDELFDALIRFVALNSGYVFWGEYIVSDEFEEDDYEDVEYFVNTAAAIPRYLPERDEFLKYSDRFYVEKTPQLDKLRYYISRHISSDEDLTEDIVDGSYFLARREAETQEYFDFFKENDLSLDGSKKKLLSTLIRDLSDNSRTWLNNGHTPAELRSFEGERPDLPSGEPVLTVKIGRNELCPCGSGKKYKKCCGA